MKQPVGYCYVWFRPASIKRGGCCTYTRLLMCMYAVSHRQPTTAAPGTCHVRHVALLLSAVSCCTALLYMRGPAVTGNWRLQCPAHGAVTLWRVTRCCTGSVFAEMLLLVSMFRSAQHVRQPPAVPGTWCCQCLIRFAVSRPCASSAQAPRAPQCLAVTGALPHAACS
jgi:hypothetical protein